MRRDRALRAVLVVVGLLFCAALYPLMLMAKQDPALAMMMSLYATPGVFARSRRVQKMKQMLSAGKVNS